MVETLSPADLLIIHAGALGDCILAFAAISRLRSYAGHIDVLCQGRLGKLAVALGLADNAFPVEAAWFASLFSDRPDDRSAAQLKSYSEIVLFSSSAGLEQSLNRLRSRPVCRIAPRPPAGVRQHLADYILQQLHSRYRIDRREEALFPVRFARQACRMPDSTRVLLQPGAGSVRKRWPLSNFLDAAARLAADGWEPEFILGPAEMDLKPALEPANLPLHTLEDLQALAALLQSAGGYIGNDSGASHLAAFMGLPSVVIFGPSDPARWAPLGRRVKIVRPPLPCLPCFETETANCNHPRCLGQTSPARVIEIFYTLAGEDHAARKETGSPKANL